MYPSIAASKPAASYSSCCPNQGAQYSHTGRQLQLRLQPWPAKAASVAMLCYADVMLPACRVPPGLQCCHHSIWADRDRENIHHGRGAGGTLARHHPTQVCANSYCIVLQTAPVTATRADAKLDAAAFTAYTCAAV
jgi:hypothetical protein